MDLMITAMGFASSKTFAGRPLYLEGFSRLLIHPWSLRISFHIDALLSIIAAILSSMTGSRFVHEIDKKPDEKTGLTSEPMDDPGWDIVE